MIKYAPPSRVFSVVTGSSCSPYSFRTRGRRATSPELETAPRAAVPARQGLGEEIRDARRSGTRVRGVEGPAAVQQAQRGAPPRETPQDGPAPWGCPRQARKD